MLVTNGSQQALDLIGKIFLNPGDAVLVEKPTYLGALQAFNQYQATYAIVPMDEDGMRVDEVERLLSQQRSGDKPIKFIYALPNFQNPTGRTHEPGAPPPPRRAGQPLRRPDRRGRPVRRAALRRRDGCRR